LSQVKVDYKFKSSPDGLGVIYFKKGKGEKLKKSQKVFVRYSMFHKSDSTVLKPIILNAGKEFLVGHDEVLPGWDLAMFKLKKGDSVLIKIPPHLAYGNKKVGSIPKKATMFLFLKVINYDYVFYQHKNLDTIKYVSGLKKIKVKSGNGIKPKPFSEIKINFTGYVYSLKGYPQIFEVQNYQNIQMFLQLGSGKLVPGLDEGITNMEVGEKATFIIPPNLGFGDNQKGKILPNTTLYFDIELVNATYPFLDLDETRKIKTPDSCFVIRKTPGKVSTTPVSTETYVTYHFKAFYKNKSNQGIIFEETFTSGQAISLRPGSRMGFPGLDKALVFLRDKDTATIIIPNNKLLNKNKLVFLPEGEAVYFDVYVQDVSPYPFLQINSNDTIVKPSGLKYLEDKSLIQPTADTVKLGSNVDVYYTITYRDSLGIKRILDCSRDREQPLSVSVGGGKIIKGFEEGLLGMKNHAARKLIIPSHLAYGDDTLIKYGVPFKSDIIMDIEYIEIIK
jgi:peptidylprolyl isomerase